MRAAMQWFAILTLYALASWASAVTYPCAGCLAQYFTTSTNTQDTSGNGYTLLAYLGGAPAVSTPCVVVGTNGAGPFTTTAYFEQDAAFRAAWANQANFAIGGYFYFTSLDPNFNFIVSATNLAANTYGWWVGGDGSVTWWHPEGAATVTLPAGTITTGVCYAMGIKNDSVAGKTMYAQVQGSPTVVTGTHADTTGTGTNSPTTYVVIGRFWSGGSVMTGYMNDLTFWTSAPSSFPFDGAVVNNQLSPYMYNSTSNRVMPWLFNYPWQ